MATGAAPKIPNARLAVLYSVMLCAAAGNTAMQSILPAIGAKMHIPDVWVSMAFSWSALLWVTTAPRWARQSDQRGRKALMILGLVGFISSMTACGLILWAGLSGLVSATVTFIVFALCRSLYGALGSAAPPAVQAYVAARTEREDRTKALSLVSSSFGLGTIIGPAVAPLLILPVFGLSGPLLSFALIGVVVLVALRIYLPDDTPRFAVRGVVIAYPSSAAVSAEDSGDDDDIGDPIDGAPLPDRPALEWRDARVRGWFIAGLLGGHAQAMMMGVIGFMILDRLHLRALPDQAADPIAIVMMSGAFATLVTQWGLIPMLGPKPRTAVIWGAALAAVGAAAVALAHDLHAIALGFAISSTGFGLFRPGFTAGASLAVPRREQGSVAGMTASINGAAYIVAPAIGVLLYNAHAAWSFALMGGLCAFVVLWGTRALADVN